MEERDGFQSSSGAKSFEDLLVWQKAHLATLAVYRLTAGFPQSELYGLSSQFRRAAVSVPANIAEGFKRRGKADKIRFYNIAQASLEEARYYVILARDLGYGPPEETGALLDETGRLLESYLRALQSPTT
ncbi:MAG TPA: four helix bundle protein [Spirochaetaceae bacterium]|jgi:four helix bundle protein|nr:four helix bundle protein [Spirochaetaceae bacterium]